MEYGKESFAAKPPVVQHPAKGNKAQGGQTGRGGKAAQDQSRQETQRLGGHCLVFDQQPGVSYRH